MGPYGTPLVKAPIYTHILAIGAGTCIVPCISLLKEHVQKMLMMEPEHYLVNMKEDERRRKIIRDAKETKDCSIVQRIFSSLGGLIAKESEQVWRDAPQRRNAYTGGHKTQPRRVSTTRKSKMQQQSIRERYAA